MVGNTNTTTVARQFTKSRAATAIQKSVSPLRRRARSLKRFLRVK